MLQKDRYSDLKTFLDSYFKLVDDTHDKLELAQVVEARLHLHATPTSNLHQIRDEYDRDWEDDYYRNHGAIEDHLIEEETERQSLDSYTTRIMPEQMEEVFEIRTNGNVRYETGNSRYGHSDRGRSRSYTGRGRGVDYNRREDAGRGREDYRSKEYAGRGREDYRSKEYAGRGQNNNRVNDKSTTVCSHMILYGNCNQENCPHVHTYRLVNEEREKAKRTWEKPFIRSSQQVRPPPGKPPARSKGNLNQVSDDDDEQDNEAKDNLEMI
jgi:hypothetical protein